MQMTHKTIDKKNDTIINENKVQVIMPTIPASNQALQSTQSREINDLINDYNDLATDKSLSKIPMSKSR